MTRLPIAALRRIGRGFCSLALLGALGVLAGCGGGNSGSAEPTADVTPADPPDTPGCDGLSRRTFASLGFRDDYLWAALTPDVDPAPNRTLDEYFRASLFAGNESLPRDRYSGYQTTESFNRFFGEGNTLGFGLAVAGNEVRGQPEQPLWIRDVNPGSPADQVGLRRGDRVLSINGLSASQAIATDNFSGLTANAAGDVLELAYERNGMQATARMVAAIHPITPVRYSQVLNLPDGRRVGLLRYQSMVSTADAELVRIFSQFRDSNVSSVILDLRYNGGGSVAVGQRMASHMTGPAANNQLYAELRYNEMQQSRNSQFRFSHTLGWQGVRRVYVLAGSRTCSASEQVIQGLRGVGIEVVTIGSTTCGKPVGSSPVSHCGFTYSLINFESINARGEGRYFNGIAANCPVSEDFRKSMEDTTEPLIAAALQHVQGRGCPVSSAPQQQILQSLRARPPLQDGPQVPSGMVLQ